MKQKKPTSTRYVINRGAIHGVIKRMEMMRRECDGNNLSDGRTVVCDLDKVIQNTGEHYSETRTFDARHWPALRKAWKVFIRDFQASLPPPNPASSKKICYAQVQLKIGACI